MSESQPPSNFPPYYWANKVHIHLHGKGLRFGVPFGIDDVRDATCAISNVKRILYVPVPIRQTPPVIHGRLKRIEEPSDDPNVQFVTGRIEFDDRLEANVKRLVICKELAQCFYSDDPTSRTAGGREVYALLEGLAAGRQTQFLLPNSPALLSEELALLTAIEILCPFDTRVEILERNPRGLKQAKLTKIAEGFGLPQWDRGAGFQLNLP